MPRNKILMKGRAGAVSSQHHHPPGNRGTTTGGGGGGHRKIVIRPYQKPPTLPPNYYEETVEDLMQLTRSVLDQKKQQLSQSQSQVQPSVTTTTTSSSQNNPKKQSKLSLQNAYTAVVNLVSHQYGIRLYQDLRISMQHACETILPNHLAVGASSSSSPSSTTSSMENEELLHLIPQLYQSYTEYLQCVKHVFLPLDRTHLWQADLQQVLPMKGTTTSTTTTTTTTATTTHNHHHQNNHRPSSSSSSNHTDNDTTMATTPASSSSSSSSSSSFSPHAQQTIWQVGLSVWSDRLKELGMEQALYTTWLQSLLEEWNPTTANAGTNSTNTIEWHSRRQTVLPAVWYMWQDLAWLSVLPLQADLEQYWKQQSQAWGEGDAATAMSTATSSSSSTSTSYRPMAFLSFCHHKHEQIHRWPWLPTTWLMTILEQCLVQPHLFQGGTSSSSSSTTQQPTEDDGLMATSSTSYYNYSSSSYNTTGKKKLLPPGLLLQPQHLNPLLEEAIFGGGGGGLLSSSTSFVSNTTHDGSSPAQTAISQLWFLAGRIPQGQAAVGQAIGQFARTYGLQRVLVGNISNNNNNKSNNNTNKKKDPTAATTTITTATTSSQINMISDLIQLQDALTRLIRSLPHGTEYINLKSVWEEVVNQETKPCSVAECLAKFLDQTLRNNKKMDQYQQQQQQQHQSSVASSSSSSSDWLGKIIAGIFVPLQAKDVFEAFYKRDLAKRLLYNRFVSMDVEKQVCSMLKAECGAAYTSKMEGMFQDVDWSRETMMVYKQAQAAAMTATSTAGGRGGGFQNNNSNNVEMEVQVLTTGYWPVYPQYPNLQLPEVLRQQQDQFTHHYKTKYQGRRMNWQYALGHCIVKCNGFARPYELVVSLCQALVLTQFGDDEKTKSKWTLPALMKAVGLEDRNEMERILQSLALGKEGTRVLRKLDFDSADGGSHSKKKVRLTVDDRDEFVLNESFESNQRRIRITNIMMKETKEEREKTVEAVSRDRLYLMDAVLVRIMKARKTILHHVLIPQVLEQVKVPAQPADVKKRIESLIEREYMERDAKDRNRYNYLA